MLTNGKEFRIYQRQKDKLQFIFCCRVENISNNINKINALIGKDSLASKLSTHQPLSVPQVYQPSIKESTKKSMKVIAIYHHKGGVVKTEASLPSRSRLVQQLKVVENQYDLVIIDTPPSLDLYAQAALTAADYLMVPSDLKPFSNQGLTSVKNFVKGQINEYRDSLGKSELKIIGVLPSKISTIITSVLK